MSETCHRSRTYQLRKLRLKSSESWFVVPVSNTHQITLWCCPRHKKHFLMAVFLFIEVTHLWTHKAEGNHQGYTDISLYFMALSLPLVWIIEYNSTKPEATTGWLEFCHAMLHDAMVKSTTFVRSQVQNFAKIRQKTMWKYY